MQNSVAENAKRVMAKAMMDEVRSMIDSGEIKTLSADELITRLSQFREEPPAERLEKIAADDAAGQAIRERVWRFGDILCADGALCLRNVQDHDRQGYLQLQQEYSALRVLLNDEQYCAKIWNGHTDPTALTLSIEKSGQYVGYCGIKDLTKTPWEIAIELLPQYTHCGIGFAAISAMLNALNDRLAVTEFRVRIDPTNLPSQALFEKLGAKPNGISKYILQSEDEIRQCEELNSHLIDDTLLAVAQKFHVEPKKLLSHVLEYTLHWS